MDKQQIFQSFEDFSQNLMVALAEVEAIKKQVKLITEENVRLRIENNNLRERLEQTTANPSSKLQYHGMERLESIYKEGFHICNDFYGQHRENQEDCVFCSLLLDRE
ncbi:DNA replication initiation control protein YabA [Streptococcus caprae]|uniref:DNA replication initiation control protein YabA n=1 Tax=Streptococcus caprae TaxID=1640501 RepID=A0ABV8CSP3_9STRE